MQKGKQCSKSTQESSIFVQGHEILIIAEINALAALYIITGSKILHCTNKIDFCDNTEDFEEIFGPHYEAGLNWTPVDDTGTKLSHYPSGVIALRRE